MNIAFIDNYDSFAHTLEAYLHLAAEDILHKRGSSEQVQIRMVTSDCTLSTIERMHPSLIVLGPGPNAPPEAGNYLEVIHHFHTTTPLFGVCLGFQACMQYFRNAPVRVLEEAVHGAASPITHTQQGIFEGIPSPASFGRYHSLGIYAHEVPQSFEMSASCRDSKNQNIIMAVYHRSLPIIGVQFHPESILSTEGAYGMQLIRNTLECLTFPSKKVF